MKERAIVPARAVLPMSARIWTAESLRCYGRLIAGRSAERNGSAVSRPAPDPADSAARVKAGGEHDAAFPYAYRVQ